MNRRPFSEWCEAYRRHCKPKRTSGSEYVGPCPSCAGDDRFHIKRASDGNVLAGCRQCEITFEDLVRLLFPRPAGEGGTYPASIDTPAEEAPEEVYGCTLDQLAERTATPRAFLESEDVQAIEVKTWISKDVGEVVSVQLPALSRDHEKLAVHIRVQVDGRDKWRYGKGSKATLYGETWLDVAQQKGKLWVCEGESDCWTLWRAGIPAVGVPGASAVRVIEAQHLEEIETLYVIEEQDEAGSQFPRRVSDRVRELGFKGAVLRLPLPAKDPNAMYQDDPQHFKARLLTLSLHARGLRPTRLEGGSTLREIMRRQYPPVRWIVPGLLREGVGLLYAPPKIGKSFIAQQLACAVSQGRPAFGCWEVDPAEVLVIDLEQIEGEAMQNRYRRFGAERDENRAWVFDHWPRIGEGGEQELGWWLDDHPHCRLVIVDVWTNIKPTSNAPGANAYDREYGPLRDLSEMLLRHHACCLLVHHDKKSDGSGDITEAASGTKALTGAASTIWRVRRKFGETRGQIDITGRGVPERTLDAIFSPEDCRWTFSAQEVQPW